MRRLSVPLLLAVAAAVGAGSWGINLALVNRGTTPLSVPLTVAVSLVLVGGLALWLGWRVRQYQAGDRPDLDPMQAAMTAVFAQATAYAGAALVGVFLGYAIAVGAEWSHEPRRAVVISALIAAGAALVLTIAGVIAERWCVVDNGDDSDKPGTRGGATPDAA